MGSSNNERAEIRVQAMHAAFDRLPLPERQLFNNIVARTMDKAKGRKIKGLGAESAFELVGAVIMQITQEKATSQNSPK